MQSRIHTINSNMSKLTLTYFPIHGRAYVARVCFGIAKVDWEDKKITGEELGATRGPTGRSNSVPLGQLPTLTLPSGAVITQSAAIARYAAKLANLYPTDPEQALLVDEIIDSVGDIGSGMPRPTDASLVKTQREEYAAGKLNTYFSFFAEKLAANNGPFLAGSAYSVADIYMYQVVKFIRNGVYDHIPADYDSKWPVFERFVQALESDAVFAPYKC